MTLVVGLGNPDLQYKNNRHNVGFMVIDALLDDHPLAEKITKSNFKGELFKVPSMLLLKPTTYMNLSGESVRAVDDYFKPEQIIVIHDDLDLPFGTLRFKIGGGHGGHNGLRFDPQPNADDKQYQNTQNGEAQHHMPGCHIL